MERDDLTRLEMFQTPTPEEMALFDKPLVADIASGLKLTYRPKPGVCLRRKTQGATMLSSNLRRDRNVSQGC
jgi:hypothetical protein